MLKKIIAGALVFILGGVWLYLDQMNKQQIREAAEMRAAMQQARLQALAKAKAAAEKKMKFAAQLQSDLDSCKAAAEQARNEYLAKNQMPVKHHPGQYSVPKNVTEAAGKMQDTANAACQATYDTRLKSGT